MCYASTQPASLQKNHGCFWICAAGECHCYNTRCAIGHGTPTQTDFWIKTKWLATGALLALRSANEKSLHFLEVVHRDVKDLNPPSPPGAPAARRAAVGVRFCDPTQMRKALSGIVKASGGSHAGSDGPAHHAAHVVQVAQDFGIYKPVLETLQSLQLVDPPFKEQLFLGQHDLQAVIAPPRWEVMPDTALWLETQLRQMDKAQRAAFEHATTRRCALIQGPPGTAIVAPLECITWAPTGCPMVTSRETTHILCGLVAS
jgi:hypothetical protein